jgi:hypothetical protein
MNDRELHEHTDRALEFLRREFADTVPADTVNQIGHDRFETLQESATINDFIPPLVFRQVREALRVPNPAPARRPPPRKSESRPHRRFAGLRHSG